MSKHKIGLIGFGRAGKAAANIILQNQEFSLEWVLRRKPLLEHRSVPEFLGYPSDEPGVIHSTAHITPDELLESSPVDFIVDFSSSGALSEYGEAAARRGVKIISAISHYGPAEVRLLKRLAKKTTVFWSPNITLGVNYLIIAAKFLRKIAPFVDIQVIEEHFRQKEGVSGTALKIADALEIKRSSINSIRAGGIVGRHEVIFGFPNQTVRLIHESIAREAFGNGTIFVARNLINKDRGFYNFEDLLLPYFST